MRDMIVMNRLSNGFGKLWKTQARRATETFFITALVQQECQSQDLPNWKATVDILKSSAFARSQIVMRTNTQKAILASIGSSYLHTRPSKS